MSLWSKRLKGVTYKLSHRSRKLQRREGEVAVKRRRPDWAAPCGGKRTHGRQSSRPPRSQEEAEGCIQQAQARIPDGRAPAVRRGHQAEAEATVGADRRGERVAARSYRPSV